MSMTHRACGGELKEDWSIPYVSEECGAVPSIICMKCGDEIVSDSEIDLGEMEEFL